MRQWSPQGAHILLYEGEWDDASKIGWCLYNSVYIVYIYCKKTKNKRLWTRLSRGIGQFGPAGAIAASYCLVSSVILRLFPNGHIFALLQSPLEYSFPPLCHLKLILSNSDKPRADHYWNNNVFQASTRIGGALALACPGSYHRHGTLLYLFLGFNKNLKFFVIGSCIMVSLSKVFPFCLY